MEDVSVIRAVLDGDVNSFEIIVERYKKLVYRIVHSNIDTDNVDEVANEIFFKAYKSLKSFTGSAPFSHWLSVIATRSCKDFWRVHYANKEDPFTDFDDEFRVSVADSISSGKLPEDIIIEDERSAIIRKAFDCLKVDERNVINLMYSEGYSVGEISTELSITESNVKVLAFRARKKLATKLSRIMEDIL